MGNKNAGDVPEVHYASKSSPDEKESTEDQLARLAQEHPDRRESRLIVGAFRDENASGYRGNRGPQLEAAVAAAIRSAEEHGEAELVVFHSSRLARGSGKRNEARALGKLFYDLREKGVTLRSLTDDEFVTREELIGMASSIAHKYSADMSYHVSRGKRQQREQGKRAGGPVPDGYLPGGIDPDPERSDFVDRMFELALEGVAPVPLMRRLNQEGYRRKNGRLLDRRAVESRLTNAYYAGAVEWYRGTPRHEINWEPAERHFAYITEEQHEALMAMRSRRDLAKGSNRRPGRPRKNHLLGNARCTRCGGPMYGHTSPYRRKADGGRKRWYRCANVHAHTGGCDAPDVDAILIEGPLVDHLRGVFIDADQWIQGVVATRAQERAGIETDLNRERALLAGLDRKIAILTERYAEHAVTDATLAEADAAALAQQREKRGPIEKRIAELQRAFETASEPTPTDAMLDFWNDLRADVDRALGSGALAEVNAALRERFAAFWIDTGPGGEVSVTPKLQPDSPGLLVWDSPEGERPTTSDPRASIGVYEENPPCQARIVTYENGGDVEPFPVLFGRNENLPDPQA